MSDKNKDRDHFFDQCFSFNIQNNFEERDWLKIDDFMGIPDLVKQHQFDKAWFILDHAAAKYTDYDFIYAWKAKILQKKGDVNGARKILRTGLKKAKSTQLLCERMGSLEFETDSDINDALKWWIRSVVLMSQSNSARRWEALLYLAAIAKILDCPSNHNILMKMVSLISVHGRLELKPETISLFEQKAPELAKGSATKALDHLCLYYLKNQIPSETRTTSENNSTTNPVQPSIESNPASPKPPKPGFIKFDKTGFYYIGFCILVIVIIIFSFYYFKFTDTSQTQKIEKSKTPIEHKEKRSDLKLKNKISKID